MKADILGVKVDCISKKAAINLVEQFLSSRAQHLIVTPNPEFVMNARKDQKFKEILNGASLAIPDGFGLKLAAWYLKQPAINRITGVDFVWDLAKLAQKKQANLYLLGAGRGVAKATAEKLKNRYPDLKIVGAESGLKQDKPVPDSVIIENINFRKPAMLLVAMGAPKQEKWIVQNIKKLNSVRVVMGVGGTFDFISGKIKRAPKLVRLFGLEWLFRLIIQPWRIKRIFTAAVSFPVAIIESKKNHDQK